MNQFWTLSSLNNLFAHALCAICTAIFISLPAHAEQLWLTQGALFHATDTLRLSLYNTIYMEHGEQFSNEVSPGFRWLFATNWSVGAGITFAQNRKSCEEVTDDGETIIHHHWAMGPRPSENIALEWTGKCGGWNFFDSNRIYMYFRKGEHDWVVYRNIFTVTAPAIPSVPWKSRPYLTQQIYFTGREGYGGLDRFSQFRTTAGLRMRPLEWLSLAAYWQYRDIERKTGEWYQSRVAGLSATLLF
jgi:hypothetical protein